MEINEMNDNERIDWLLNNMRKDSEEYKNINIPEDLQEKKNLLRAFMNIRMPGSIDKEILRAQDEYLLKEAIDKGVVILNHIPSIKEQLNSSYPFADKISIWKGDITRLKVGAIVNAANSQMLGCFIPCHRCIDNAIHSAAGMQLREECNNIMKQKRIKYGKQYDEPAGTAIITSGYNLPCDYIIHTVGPIVRNKLTDALRRDLQKCYESSLKCAIEHNIRSIAFCCISTGEFHFPNDEAAKIAVDTVYKFLESNNECFDRIIFNVFKNIDKDLYEELLGKSSLKQERLVEGLK